MSTQLKPDIYPTFEITATDDGIRPAGKPDECFFCHQHVGSNHTKGCAITWRLKTVKLLAVVEFEEEVPEHWTNEDIRFRYNKSTWCALNLWGRFDDGTCGCSYTKVVLPEDLVDRESPS